MVVLPTARPFSAASRARSTRKFSSKREPTYLGSGWCTSGSRSFSGSTVMAVSSAFLVRVAVVRETSLFRDAFRAEFSF
ncbi:unnamed protein product [Chondrus crispus]|uniref:Uncharacterized protein n=1 Tax=Chondrus crispus TaxID=2769 RepID=R7QKV3_CHOCR|nr:unnamed protein product [Chondrus crispus]CDF38714.1 unnamed protein product [Chondrus crispus]|eukprot:XP_005718619.1 unnamed protein product [Chondrus crispus]